MSEIRIFMCCHKGYLLVPPLCSPIQCGAALNPPVMGTIPDSTGDSISPKNREYCELTAHYFAWKNIASDYYGFCHYRRFFCAKDSVKRPYLALGRKADNQLLGDEQFWRGLIEKFEIIVPKSEDMGITAKEHYCTSKHHYTEDIELFLDILAEKAPQLKDAADNYLSQDRQYFCNMFIMDREHFFEYCSILFSVLKEFDRHKAVRGHFLFDRTDGYLGEIFTGIYIMHCRTKGTKIKELPRLDMYCSVGKRLSCALLPPESKRRFFAKKLVKKLRGK